MQILNTMELHWSLFVVIVGTLKLCLDEKDKQLTQKLLYLRDNDFLR